MENFSKNLKLLRESRGFSQKQMSEFINVNPTTWNNYETGVSNPNLSGLIEISNFFGVSESELLHNVHLISDLDVSKKQGKSTPKSTPNGTPNLPKELQKSCIPLIPVNAIGGYSSGGVHVLESDIIDYYYIPDFIKLGVNFLIVLKGTSMSPTYMPGDLLACMQISTKAFIRWGSVYVLDTTQGPIVKRIYSGKSEDYLECVSDNLEMYPSYQIQTKEINQMYLVVGFLRFD